jgi:hypothetical protein
MNIMDPAKIKKIIINSLDTESDPAESLRRLEDEGIAFDFSRNFGERVLDRIYTSGLAISREVDYIKTFYYVFFRIALTGVAAIVLLLISIYLKEGSLSLNSFLGINDNYAESIVCLLTGN